MNYTVVWRPTAEQQLAAIWLAAADRASVTTSAHRVDQILASSPLSEGRWLLGTTRLLIVPPLGVVYEVVEDDKRVYVLFAGRVE
jgi:hypothetical protein